MVFLIYSVLAVIFSLISSQYIFGGDSAEFSAIAHTWSIPHPPGYPLYSLLLNCITRLVPFGTIPWKASLLSVIPTIVAAYFIYKILRHMSITTYISLLFSLLYVVLFPVWEYALVPEAFALNSLLIICITYTILVFKKTKNIRYLSLTSFLIGLCIAHHHIFIIYLPGWLYLLKDSYQAVVKSIKSALKYVLFFVLGTLFYLYVPIASSLNPPIQWENGKTILGFWRLFTRAAYGTFTAYGGSKGDILNQLYDVLSFFIFVFQDFRIIGVIFVAAGLWYTLRHKNQFTIFMAISSSVHVFFLFYTNFMLSSSFSLAMYERFLISFYFICVLYAAIGYTSLTEVISHFLKPYTHKKSMKKILSVFFILFLTIYVGTVAVTNYRSLSYIAKGQDFDRLGKDIVSSIPSGGIFYASSDNAHFAAQYTMMNLRSANPPLFFQLNFIKQSYYVEQFKKKNSHLKYPKNLSSPEGVEQFIKMNKDRGIYLESPMPYGFWMPYGLLWKYYDTQEEALTDLSHIVESNEYLWSYVYHIPELTYATRSILHLQAVQDLYIEAYSTYAKLEFYANKPFIAQKIMESILTKYRPSSGHSKMTLLNLLLLDKKCKEAKIVVEEFEALPTQSLKPEYIAPLLQYYLNCDSNNKAIQELKKIKDKNKDSLLTPLNRF